jgi:predicted RND superfamily exporter protein
MGFFLAAVMLTNVLLSITLHPLMLYAIRPRFIRRASPAGVDGTTLM